MALPIPRPSFDYPKLRMRCIVAVLLVALAVAPAHAQETQDYSEVVQGEAATGLVALTFDAGIEGGGAAPQVLEILRERGLHVTFFLAGQWVDHNPELAQQIVRSEEHTSELQSRL